MHFILGDEILQGPEPEMEHKQSLTEHANLQIDLLSEVDLLFKKKKKTEKGMRAAGRAHIPRGRR